LDPNYDGGVSELVERAAELSFPASVGAFLFFLLLVRFFLPLLSSFLSSAAEKKKNQLSFLPLFPPISSPSSSSPKPTVEFMQGSIGQPAGGFPEPLRSRVLKGAPVVEGRPGASMPPADLAGLGAELRALHGPSITPRDVLSAALYPKVFEEFKEWEMRYSRYTSVLPTRAFLAPLAEDEEVEVELAPGNTVSIRYKATSQLQPDGKREVFFEANGIPRTVEVVDTRTNATGSGGDGAPLRRAARERADPSALGSVGAPMAGTVVEVKAKPGASVKAGEPLAVLSAMKMETAVCAPCDGVVQHVAVDAGDSIDAGDLVVRISGELPDVTDDARASMDEAAALAAATSGV